MGKITDLQDWFNTKRNNVLRVDEKILNIVDLLPKEVKEYLDKLEEAKESTDEYYNDASYLYRQASENREDVFKNLQDKRETLKSFKEEHHSFFAKLMYNITPLRFFSVGREYQRLRKEIKMLKREHSYWTKCSDEKKHNFADATERRKQAGRELTEFKKNVVDKSNIYKEEFKFIREYEKLSDFDENKIKKMFGQKTKNTLENYIKTFVKNWYKMENIKPSFDTEKVAVVLRKMRKGQELNENDNKIMRAIIPGQDMFQDPNADGSRKNGRDNFPPKGDIFSEATIAKNIKRDLVSYTIVMEPLHTPVKLTSNDVVAYLGMKKELENRNSDKEILVTNITEKNIDKEKRKKYERDGATDLNRMLKELRKNPNMDISRLTPYGKIVMSVAKEYIHNEAQQNQQQAPQQNQQQEQ